MAVVGAVGRWSASPPRPCRRFGSLRSRAISSPPAALPWRSRSAARGSARRWCRSSPSAWSPPKAGAPPISALPSSGPSSCCPWPCCSSATAAPRRPARPRAHRCRAHRCRTPPRSCPASPAPAGGLRIGQVLQLALAAFFSMSAGVAIILNLVPVLRSTGAHSRHRGERRRDHRHRHDHRPDRRRLADGPDERRHSRRDLFGRRRGPAAAAPAGSRIGGGRGDRRRRLRPARRGQGAGGGLSRQPPLRPARLRRALRLGQHDDRAGRGPGPLRRQHRLRRHPLLYSGDVDRRAVPRGGGRACTIRSAPTRTSPSRGRRADGHGATAHRSKRMAPALASSCRGHHGRHVACRAADVGVRRHARADRAGVRLVARADFLGPGRGLDDGAVPGYSPVS